MTVRPFLTANPLSAEALAAELHRWGITYIAASESDLLPAPPSPELLLVSLSSSDEARLRLALIPLFLAHPELADLVPEVARQLVGPSRVVLVCYYAAARLLQQKYVARLAALGVPVTLLPDHFGPELGLPAVGEPDELLQMLAQRHAVLSGRPLNWLGTYEQAARQFMRRLELEAAWAMS